MKIGVLGHGNIGGSLGRIWASAGHEVMLSGRDPEAVAEEVAGIERVQAGSNLQAARFGDVVLLAVPWPQLGASLSDGVAQALSGKIVIDATNPYGPASIPVDPSRTHSEQVAAAIPGAQIVKAFNMMQATVMAAHAAGGPRCDFAIPIAGDDDKAKADVAILVNEAGFAAVDAGLLSQGHHFEPGAPLYDVQIDADSAVSKLNELEGEDP
ncbi:MAG: NADPH-dependent F420 reductase [Sphingorhabdus sp.]